MRLPNLETFRDEYQQNDCVKIPAFFDEITLKFVDRLFTKDFAEAHYDTINWTEYSLSNHNSTKVLDMLVNAPQLIEAAKAFFQVKDIIITSRLYYFTPQSKTETWHTDTGIFPPRFAAVRIELSKELYEGGVFHFKKTNPEKVFNFSQGEYGDGVLFKISDKDHAHMVDQVTKGTRRSLILFFCDPTFIPPGP